jgi:hypothetical protein
MLKECKTKECQNKLLTATMEETRKRGRPRKRWREDVEEYLNII